MTPSFHFYLRCFLSLLALVIILSSAISIIRKKKPGFEPHPDYRQQVKNWKKRASITRKSDAFSTIKNLMVLVIGIVIGIPVGYFGHDMTQGPLHDVMILKKRDASHFRVQLITGQQGEINFCKDSPVDLEAGQKLSWFNYEQRIGCKSLKGKDLGYFAYTDNNGNRIYFPVKEELADER